MLRRPSPAIAALGGLVLLYLIAPNLIIVPLSFNPTEFFQFPPSGLSLRWYRQFFADPDWLEALLRSARVGTAVTVLSLVLGTAAAFGVSRGPHAGRGVLRALLIAPLIIPHVVLAASIYIFYVRLQLRDTEVGLILAHTMLAMPVVMITVTASLRAAKRDLELAAMSLGATPGQTFVKVTLPLVRPGLVTGGIFAFITSFDELIIALFVTSVRSKTLPLKMWEGATQEISPVLHVVATILIAVSLLLLSVGELVRWRLGQGSGRAGA